MNFKQAADYAAFFMKEQGVIVQRYDSKSTNSIYLKFDYGVAYTLRISDHRGKNHLTYRYNVRGDIDKAYSQGSGSCEMNFYPLDEIDACLRKILIYRAMKIAKYGMESYQRHVNQTYEKKIQTDNRFWNAARIM